MRNPETRRQNPHDGGRAAVDRHGPAHQTRIAAELCAPEVVADDGGGWSVEAIVVSDNQSATRGARAAHIE